MSTNQTLRDLLNELPQTFVNLVMDQKDLRTLREMKSRHRCYNRRALIDARIEKLTYKLTS